MAIEKATGGGFTSSAPTSPPTQPSGSDGVASYGGFIVSGERDPRLTNREKWVTFSNLELNVSIISAALNVWTKLGGSAKWTVEPNPLGGKDAKRGADIVRQGLIEAPLSTPWAQVVRRQLTKVFRGFALHEAVIRRRSDGMVVYADLLDRPQWTVWRWNKPDDQSAWLGVEQLTRYGDTKYIPRERLFYSVESTLSSDPAGVGLLRQCSEPARVLELYQQWEGIGLQTDLRGIPKARAPISKLRAMATAAGKNTEPEIQAFIVDQAKFIVDFLLGHNKRSDQGVLLDSATFTSKDAAQSPSAINEWDFDIVSGGASGMGDVNTAIGRQVRDIARIMNAEWLLLGDVGSGSDAMHEDKTAMFGLVANSALDDLAADTERDLATRLIALNGLDPETCTPKVRHEPVMRGAVAEACTSLQALFMAGLNPKDPATNILRGRMDLPPAPEVDETQMLLPRGTELGTETPGGAIAIDDPNAAAQPGGPRGAGPAPAAAAPGKAGNTNARPENAAPPVKKYSDDQPRAGDDIDDDVAAFDDVDLDDMEARIGEDDDELEKFNDDQPRDQGGRWSSGGGGSGGGDPAARSGGGRATPAQIDRAKGKIDRVAEKIKAAKVERTAARRDARKAVTAAKGAAAKAEKNPTKENKAAAKAAKTAAGQAMVKLERRELAVDRHAAAHADAKSKLAELRGTGRRSTADKKPEPPKPPPDFGAHSPVPPREVAPRDPSAGAPAPSGAARETIANGLSTPAAGEHPQFNAPAQAALRGEARSEVADWGVHQRDSNAVGTNKIDVRELGQAQASIDTTTFQVSLAPDIARSVAEYHKEDPEDLGKRSMQGDSKAFNMIYAQHCVVHEQVHACGPDFNYQGTGVFGEELTTEMSARVISGEKHGLDPETFSNGAYHWVINPAVEHLAAVSGTTFNEAHRALATASLEHKQGKLTRGLIGTKIHGENVLHNVATSALKHLGVHDGATHLTAWRKFMEISKNI